MKTFMLSVLLQIFKKSYNRNISPSKITLKTFLQMVLMIQLNHEFFLAYSGLSHQY